MSGASIPLILPRINDKQLEFKKYLNFLLALMDRRNNAETVQAMPFEVTIDPATVCQLSCPYCSVGAGTMSRARGVLRPQVHRQMLDDLAESLFIVWYFSTGEPLLNRFLPEIIAATRDKGIYSVISTNLSLKLSDERIDKLLTCGLGCISVSIDGASAETYARYRVGGNFDLVISNLRRLVERKRALGLDAPYLEWRFLVFRHNAHEIAQARQMAQEIGVDLQEFFPGYAPPEATDAEVQQLDEPIDLSPVVSGPALQQAANRPPTALLSALDTTRATVLSYAEKIARKLVARRGKQDLKVPFVIKDEELRQKCDWLYFGSTLFPNGSVGPCCLSNEEPDDFGQLSEDTHFKEVWNNAMYRETRSLWKTQQWDTSKSVCARCPDRRAQDYQFRTTVQALLRNAPDWVIKILASDSDRFFFALDRKLTPVEFDALTRCDDFLSGDYQQEQQWLLEAAEDKPTLVVERLDFMRDALAISSPHGSFFGRLSAGLTASN